MLRLPRPAVQIPYGLTSQVEAGEVRVEDEQCRDAVLQELTRVSARRASATAGPRLSQPSGLIATGGHDAGWQSLR